MSTSPNVDPIPAPIPSPGPGVGSAELVDQTDQADDQAVASRVRADVEVLSQVTEIGFEVEGEAVAIEGQRWVIYGHSAYDGEVILAEYDDLDEAHAVLRAVSPPRNDL